MSVQTIWFDKPAGRRVFTQTFPFGNGRLGAVSFGDPFEERLQLNEESLWYGGPMNRVNPDALEILPKVRQLIRAGRIPEAERLMRYHMAGIPQSMRPYQPLCDLTLQFCAGGGQRCDDYRRELLLDSALVRTSFTSDGVYCEREYFASAPDDCIVMYCKAGEPGQGALSLDALLTRERFYDGVKKISDDTILIYGRSGPDGVSYALALRAAAFGSRAKVRVAGENLVVEDADEAVLYAAGGTTFRYVKEELFEKPAAEVMPAHQEPDAVLREARELEKELCRQLDAAQSYTYDELKARHIADYQELYIQSSLKLVPEQPAQNISASGLPSQDRNEEEKNSLPTDERLAAVRKGARDNALVELYWNYARYLLISCSRKGGLPANLQGIWNNSFLPPWDSKYTININTQMNYWPAEMLGLSDCHQPLFTLLKMITVSGRKTAREMYGCRGAVVHHNTDIWADTAPQDLWIPATWWVMAGAWLCTHVWQHYEYTQDAAWLDDMFDVLEQHALFYTDYVTAEDGGAVISPSVSPENTYIMEDGTQGRVCSNSTMDVSILKEFLQDYLAAAKVLEKGNPEVLDKAGHILELLPPLKIGRYGQIMEWERDYEEAEPGHRHISQLYGLFPGREISMRGTPQLAKAALATIERRLSYGGGHTGWSCAWLIGLYAKLGEAALSEDMLYKLLRESTAPNLMDTHPRDGGVVFQIDGNFGACAAITLMLVQEEQDQVILLPACPADWKEGSLKGVRLKGNAKLSFDWQGGRVKSIRIAADGHYRRTLLVNETAVRVELNGGEKIIDL